MKSPRDALTDLAEWQQALGPLGNGALLALREKALLAAGEVDTLRAELAALPGSQVGTPRGPEPLPMREWDDWLAAEGVQAHPLLKDGPCVGKFEVVDIQGRVRVETHEAVPTVLSLARFSDLRVRNVHLLIGPKAGILRPHPWHLQMGEFPYPHPNVLARGTAGAVLRGAGLWKRVDDPLVAQTLRAKWAASHEMLRAAVERGQKDGSVRNAAPSAALADLLLALMAGLRVNARADFGAARQRRAVDLALSVLDSG